MEITITKSENLKVKPPVKGLPFGKVFTDHMFLMNYTEGQGWHDPRVVPYAPIPFELGTTVFHYGQEMFEGMKAYRTAEGKIQMFRPMENINRMNNSGERLCIPHIPEDMFMNALKTLITVEQDWVPSEEGTSLYIRPFVIATDVMLGVHASHTYLFAIICCVVDGEEVAFVGDRLETDIAIGVKNGLKACLVFTGVTTPEMYEKSDIKATAAFENIGELGKALI